MSGEPPRTSAKRPSKVGRDRRPAGKDGGKALPGDAELDGGVGDGEAGRFEMAADDVAMMRRGCDRRDGKGMGAFARRVMTALVRPRMEVDNSPFGV